jgi:pyruvoyl-dependent arginine decarboxylase
LRSPNADITVTNPGGTFKLLEQEQAHHYKGNTMAQLTSGGASWFRTRAVVLTSGVGIGNSQIVAFDSALRAAKIADFNLIRVSSIVPAGVPIYTLRQGVGPISGNGCMLPAVYACTASGDQGEFLSGAVGVGVPRDPAQSGVIFFREGLGQVEADCVGEVADMVREAMTEVRHIDDDAYDFRCVPASAPPCTGKKWRAALSALCFADDHLWTTYFEPLVEPFR